MSRRGFEGLEVWQKARRLMIEIHERMVPLLPPKEKWGLARQVRASSKSVMANIAEGYGRYYFQDNVRFCYVARGSLDETTNHLITALDLDYIPKALYEDLRSLADETRRLLNGYISFLKRRKQGEDEPGSHSVAYETRDTYDFKDSVTNDTAQ